MHLPADLVEERTRVAARYLRGRGIEIGALDSPTPLPPGATVRYVDFRTVPELHRQYPELAGHSFVDVDVVDDGERLEKFRDGSIEFKSISRAITSGLSSALAWPVASSPDPPKVRKPKNGNFCFRQKTAVSTIKLHR